MMLGLSFKLAALTIVEGDHYRDISDNKRLKQITVAPRRGEIRDRNGVLLAGNKSSPTVQVQKDELARKDNEEKNEILLTLARLLEEDGVVYVYDFPVDFNRFDFTSESIYEERNTTPVEQVIDLIMENNLLPQILETYYIHPDYEEHYQFITVNKAINGIERKSIEVPIISSLENGELAIDFNENKDIKAWKENHEINSEATPKDAIIHLIDEDRNLVRKIIDHPISRQLIYNILKDNGLNKDLILREYSLTYNEEYLQTKRDFIKDFKAITFETEAKDDFVNIIEETSLIQLLERVIEIEESGDGVNRIVPGEILIQKIEEVELNSPVELKIDEETNTAKYILKDKELNPEEDPIEVLISFAKKEGLLKDFITDEDIKAIAQEIMLNNDINPKISITDWEYVSIRNRNNWFEKFKISDDKNEKVMFEELIEYFEIDKSLSKYEARIIMSLYDQLDKQGLRAYEPINIAYGIKDSTVAKIEEGLMETPGIQVSYESVRNYPEGESAAHLLGYLGKISQSSEIEEYVNEKDYSPNDIIGKTGIEENFEAELRGENGIKTVEVDVLGNTTNVIGEEAATPGNNINLTIDSKLQKVTEEALKEALDEIRVAGAFKSKWGDYKYGISDSKGKPYNNATSGAVVVTNVKTGEILSSASYPAYDPNLFSTGISTTDWEGLFPEHEEDLLAARPLRNIAIRTALEPGSVFKMVPALAAMEKGLSPEKSIRTMGQVEIGNEPYRCWLWEQSKRTHGRENLTEALRDSCNYYFYSLMLGENQKTGESLGMKLDIEDIMDMSNKLGLNDKTGIEIDIPSERSGGVPSPEKYEKAKKVELESWLNNNIHKYLRDDVDLEDEEIDVMIEEIISWSEEAETPSRTYILNRLYEMGFYTEKVLADVNKKQDLVDIIFYNYIRTMKLGIGESLDISIGQGAQSYTPIQMTNAVATLVNGGYKNNLTLIDSIKNYDNEIIKEREVNSERIELKDYEHLDYIKKGMNMVATEGSAEDLFENFPVSVGVKTGTAENDNRNPITKEKYDSDAWYVGFAPYEEPEIAVSVVLIQGGSGGYAGPITREIFAEYFGYNSKGKKETLPIEPELAR